MRDEASAEERLDAAFPRPEETAPGWTRELVLAAASGCALLFAHWVAGSGGLFCVGPIVALVATAAGVIWGARRSDVRLAWARREDARAMLALVMAGGGVARRADLPEARPPRYVDPPFLAGRLGLRIEGPFLLDEPASRDGVRAAETRLREAAERGTLDRETARRWTEDPVTALALHRLLRRGALERTPEGIRPTPPGDPYRGHASRGRR